MACSPLNYSNTHEIFSAYLEDVCSDHHVDHQRLVTEKHPRHQFSFFFMGLGGTLVNFFGVIVNLLALTNLAVYRAFIPEKAVYISAVICWDCFLLINGWISLSLSVLVGKGQLSTSGSFAAGYSYVQALMHVSLTGVAWSTVVLTIDRYITVCRPLLASRNIKARRAIIAVSLMSFAAISYNIPRFFEVNYTECCDMQSHRVVTEAIRASFAMPGKPYYFWYRLVSKAALVAVLPFMTLCVLTVLIISRVRRWDFSVSSTVGRESFSVSVDRYSTATARRKSIFERSRFVKTQKQLSRVLSFVLIKFLVCHCPIVLNDVMECILFASRKIDEDVEYQFFSYSIDVANFLVLFHSASTGAFFLVFSRRGIWRRRHSQLDQIQHQKLSSSDHSHDEETGV